MKIKNLNSASLKTDKKIKSVFIELLSEKKELSNIKVSDLVKRADITRTTFYNHYNNVYEIAKSIEDENIKIFIDDIEEFSTIEGINNYFDKIFAYIKKHEDIYKKIFSSNSPLLFAEKLIFLFKKRIQNFDKKNKDFEFESSFFANACVLLVIQYFRGETNYSLEEINTYIKKLCAKIYKY